ncbi:MAG: hypothetical protein ACJ786_29980, partial [Catenulispora sp.]
MSVVALAPHAAAAGAGWSRSPAAGIGGATVRVASTPDALCQWLAPTPPTTAPATTPRSAPTAAGGGDPVVDDGTSDDATPTAAALGDPVPYDGQRVELRLDHEGTSIALGHVPVSRGGAWSGTVTVPEAAIAPAGGYDLVA